MLSKVRVYWLGEQQYPKLCFFSFLISTGSSACPACSLQSPQRSRGRRVTILSHINQRATAHLCCCCTFTEHVQNRYKHRWLMWSPCTRSTRGSLVSGTQTAVGQGTMLSLLGQIGVQRLTCHPPLQSLNNSFHPGTRDGLIEPHRLSSSPPQVAVTSEVSQPRTDNSFSPNVLGHGLVTVLIKKQFLTAFSISC